MKIVLDTNILTRSAQPGHPHHEIAIGAVRRLASQREQLFLIPQVIYEFWVVATRPPGENGLNISVPDAVAMVSELRKIYALLDDHPGILGRWLELVSKYDVKGKAAHDARIVAAMGEHGIEALLTFNGRDFSRYREVEVLGPADVVAA